MVHTHFTLTLIRSEVKSTVSQVQILGLAPKVCSDQSNRKAGFIGIMRKQEQVLQSYRSK